MPLVATEERETLAAERVSIFLVVTLTFALMVSRATSVVDSVCIASDKWLVKVFSFNLITKCSLTIYYCFRFFFELMVKSMVEYLGSNGKLDSPRKQRFPDRYLEDVSRLVVLVTTEILVRQRRDGKDSKVLKKKLRNYGIIAFM